MKIRTNLYLITAVLLTSNFLTLCEGDDGHEFSDHLDHLDHLDDLHDINNFDDNNVIHSVELVQHNEDAMTKYATTSHANQETNKELFTNTIPIIQQSNVPTTFTKVVKETVIKQSNNDGNNSPKPDLSMTDLLYSNNKSKENGIGNAEHISLPPIPSQQASDLQGNIKNIIRTTVTKTTTSGSPSNELNGSFNIVNNLDALPSNHILSTMSSANSNYDDGTAGSSSSQSNSMDENSKIQTISTTENIIGGNGFGNSKRISRTPGGSFRHMKTTIIKQHNINDSNDRSDLGKSTMEFNRENTSLDNIVSSMINPSGYNTVTTSSVDRDSNAFNKGIPSRRQQTRLNNINGLRNSVSETGGLQNSGSLVQTKTTIIKNERAANEIKLDGLNDDKIGYNINGGMSTSNNIVSSMINPIEYNTLSTTTVDRNSNAFNNGNPSRRQQTRFNKFNGFGNSVSETGGLQNSGSLVQTKTTIIKNGRGADEIKPDDLNDIKIDYNINDGMSTSNNIGSSNYIISSNKNGNDNNGGYSYSYGYGNGNGGGGLNNNMISSNHLMGGSSSGGYSAYIMSDGYSKGNGKGKKRKKNGSKKYKGGRSKNISYGKSKGNGQIRVKNGRNYQNTRSSRNRSGGSSKYYSSTNFVRGPQSKSFSSSASSSDELSIKKKPCHCSKGRKLNKRDSSESNGSSHSKGHRGPGSQYLGSSMDNQPMQNNGDFISGFPSPLSPSMELEPQPNLLFDMVQGQRPDGSLNYSQSDLKTVFNGLDSRLKTTGLEETRSQLINDHQLPNIDVSNQYLTYQIPNTGSLYKSDSQQEQNFGPPGLGPGPGPGPGPGQGPHPGHGPGPYPGHGPGPYPGHGPGPHPGRGPGPQAYPLDSKPYFMGDYPKYFEQNLRPLSLSQSPYPYSFNQDYHSDFSKMGLTTPELTDIQSGLGNQINIYDDLPQMQQNTEGTGINRMDALNSGSMITSTRSNMIRNADGGPIMQYFKTIKKTESIDGNGTPDMQIVQTQSVPPEVDSYGIPNVFELLQTSLELILQMLPGFNESGINA
ncbi:probable cyclin-dependent serine/threonine-protein kinase DDB_G0292550 [Myzus persicae]|uniref:probable cyclin-dependent serine/threonine-protein kinase DDB_G0292550 n=1 Tax=Myzus persicae TaxID=13164 RepID=UPI000B930C16|nr:probable cyclin-dependent serine/threonine-protein kinase DDB_G0292550 [Myzus persicae]